MIRLTLLLLVGLGIAMMVGGRDLSPEEMAQLGLDKQPAGAAAADTAEVVTRAEATPSVAPVTPPKEPDLLQAAAPVEPAPAEADDLASAVDLAVGQDSAEAGVEAEPAPEDVAAEVEPAPIEDEIAAALSDAQVWYVTGNVVNVRSGPSTEFAVVGKVTYGEATEILSNPDDDWVKIRIEGDGVEGYIARRFLQDGEPNG